MEATELHRLATDIVCEALADRAAEVSVSAWCHVTNSTHWIDYTLLVSAEKSDGEKFHMSTGEGISFVRTPEECLELLRSSVLPALCDFMGISGVTEYDPIAMGA